jgi:hypothetical protein
LSRLWFAGRGILADSLWAEDGLHAICAERHGVLRCALEPYAGFLHVLPRLLGGLVAAFPVARWALASNLLAAACAGAVAAAAWVIATRARLPRFGACALAAIPVAHPILAIESVNSISNLYVPLLYLVALSVALPTILEEIGPVAAGAAAALITLSVPIAVLAVIPLALQRLRGSTSRRLLFGVGVGALVGATCQVAAMLTTDEPRIVALERARLVAWIRLSPSAVVSMLPSLSFSDARVFEDPLPLGDLGQAALCGLLILGAAACACSREVYVRAAGIMACLGLAVSAVSSMLLGPTTRYLVWLALPAAAALLLLIQSRGLLGMPLRNAAAALVVVLLWAASWPATSTRSSVGYSWTEVLGAARTSCSVSGVREVPLTFAPSWPSAQVVLPPQFDNRVECRTVERVTGP